MSKSVKAKKLIVTKFSRSGNTKKTISQSISELSKTARAGGRDKLKAKQLIVTELSETVNTNKTMSQSISELSVIVRGLAISVGSDCVSTLSGFLGIVLRLTPSIPRCWRWR